MSCNTIPYKTGQDRTGHSKKSYAHTHHTAILRLIAHVRAQKRTHETNTTAHKHMTRVHDVRVRPSSAQFQPSSARVLEEVNEGQHLKSPSSLLRRSKQNLVKNNSDFSLRLISSVRFGMSRVFTLKGRRRGGEDWVHSARLADCTEPG